MKAGAQLSAQAVPCELFSEVGCLDNEMGYMFYYNLGGKLRDDKTGTQTALGGQQLTGIYRFYWSDSEFAPYGAWFFVFDFGGQNVANYALNDAAGWAVRSGDSAYVLVPEPSSVLLIGFGLLALGWMRRHYRHAFRDIRR